VPSAFQTALDEQRYIVAYLGAQPAEAQAATQLLPATTMHEAGKFELLNLVEVDGQWHYTFSGAGEAFSKAPGLNVANPDAPPPKKEVLR